MWQTMRAHEAFVRAVLAGKHVDLSFEELRVFHEKQIRFMQHERLVHLLVLLFCALFLLLSVGFLMALPAWPAFALTVLLLPLVGAYMLHYYRLENGIQRWYQLSNQIDARLGATARRFFEGPAEPGAGRPPG